MTLLAWGVGAAVLWQALETTREISEREQAWRKARRYCDSVGKPLLVIGMRHNRWSKNGDVTLDSDVSVRGIQGGVQGDVRKMGFFDKQFGVCFNSHVLEHLYSLEDVKAAVAESVRVADIAMFLCPSPNAWYSNLFLPQHHLRLWFEGNTIYVTPNTWRTGLGWSPSKPGPVAMGQVMEVADMPSVYARQGDMVLTMYAGK